MGERYNGISKIRTYDEYKDSKDRLDGYVDEYKWYKSNTNPLEFLSGEMDKIIEKRNNALTSEEARVAEAEGQQSRVRFTRLREGNYENRLLQNIAALVITTDEYEARISNKGFFHALIGDREAIENLKKKYVFMVANLTGEIPGEVALTVESVPNILVSLQRSNEWINITPVQEEQKSAEQSKDTSKTKAPEKQETALVEASESVSRIKQIVDKIVAEYLEDRIDDEKETTPRIEYKSATKSVEKEERKKTPTPEHKQTSQNKEERSIE